MYSATSVFWRITDYALYGMVVVLCLASLFRQNLASLFIYLILGLFIMGGNNVRDQNKSTSLLYGYLFVAGIRSVSDPRIYVAGLVARVLVIYQVVQLFNGKSLWG